MTGFTVYLVCPCVVVFLQINQFKASYQEGVGFLISDNKTLYSVFVYDSHNGGLDYS